MTLRLKEMNRTAGILLVCLLFGSESILHAELLHYSAFLILGLLVATGTPEDDCVLFTALLPFAGMASLFDYNLIFLFLLWSVVKLVTAGYTLRYPVLCWVVILLFFGTVLLDDLFHASIGRLLYLLSIQLYLTAFILFGDVGKLSVRKMRQCLLGSLSIALLLSVWAALSENADMIERFGEQARQLGGAMGLPVYCLLILAILLEYYLNEAPRFTNCLFAILYMAVTGLLGLLTLSRVFLLGLCVLFLCLLWLLRKGFAKRIFYLLMAAIILIGLFWILFPSQAGRLLDLFYLRLQDTMGSGRIEIYKDCLEYLFKDPLRLLLGNGAFHYVEIGGTEGYAFQAMAHNLYLDLLMSWGVVGVAFFGMTVGLFINRLKTIYPQRPRASSVLAIWTLAACFLTEGTMQYYNVYFYLLFLLCNRYIVTERGRQDETDRHFNLPSGE